MKNFLKKQKNFFNIETSFSEIQAGIMAREALPLNYEKSLKEIRTEEKNILHKQFKIDFKNQIFLNQTHSDIIRIIKDYPKNNSTFFADGDSLITNLKNLLLVIRTADCVPVLLYDYENKVLAMVHSGWKGTQLEIVKKTILSMRQNFKSNPKNILVYILPSIGPQSYEVKMDVAQYFEGFFETKNSKIYLDLWSKIKASALDAGINETNIFNQNICNLQSKDMFFTHRGGDKGRNLNFAFIDG